jgi:NADPH:quinone reductase-like Zn-dependent oxidoreductase
MGSTMRVRSKEEKGKVARRLLEAIWPSLPGKQWIKPVIDSAFPLRDARLAHERLESGEHIGKIVLTV